MKKIALTLSLLAAMPLALAAEVSKEDLKKLTAAGISDAVILSYCKSHGPIVRLSAEDVIELKQAGASENLLAAILAAPGSAPRAQAPAVATPNLDATTPPTSYIPSTATYAPAAYYEDYYLPSYYPSSYWYPACYYGPTWGVGVGWWGGRTWWGNRGGFVGGRFGGGFSAFGGHGTHVVSSHR